MGHARHRARCPHSISVYKSSQGAKKVRLQQFFAPEKATVMSLAGSPRSLYAGLVDGAVAVYAKAEGKGSAPRSLAAPPRGPGAPTAVSRGRWASPPKA